MNKFLWLVLVAGACHSERPEQPKPYWTSCENLGWLTKVENDYRVVGLKGEIFAYHYNGQVVFLVKDNCASCADMMSVVYDCSGKPICEFGGIAGLNTCPDFFNTAIDKTLVWKN